MKSRTLCLLFLLALSFSAVAVAQIKPPPKSEEDEVVRVVTELVDVPVVVITGRDTDEARERAIAAGAAAYLRKPVDDQSLLSTLAAAIARGRKGRM